MSGTCVTRSKFILAQYVERVTKGKNKFRRDLLEIDGKHFEENIVSTNRGEGRKRVGGAQRRRDTSQSGASLR